MHPFSKNDRKSGLSKISRICLCVLLAFSATGPVFIASADPVGNFTYEYDYGNFSLIHRWTADNGNMTGSFNVSCNDMWYNGTWTDDGNWHGNTWYNGTAAKFNDTGPAHWSNITVYVYNVTNSNLSYIGSNSVPVDNNPINITNVTPEITIIEGETIYVDVNSMDHDNDVPIFSCTMNAFDFNNDTGKGSWTTYYNDAGTYDVNFSVSDGYGSSDSEIMKITVLDTEFTPAHPVNFENKTGNFWVLHSWKAGEGNVTDAYNVSYNGTEWKNVTASVSEFNHTGLSAHDWSNITVYAYNATTGTISTGVDVNVQIPNSAPVLGSIGNKEVEENKNVEFDLSADDVDHDNLIFSMTSDELKNATLNESSGHFNWTPVVGENGTYNVDFSVTDGSLTDNETIVITVTKINSESTDNEDNTGSSGGSGGGGSQTTGEAYENIEFKDYTLKPVVKDRETMFEFSREDNSIISVSFTTSINGGQTKTIIEVLKDTSTLVKSAPSGKVYRNLNIWVGDGKLIPRLISDAQIVFKVEKSWIESKGVDADSIKLLRYSGSSWTQLQTSQTGENDEYFFYVAETPGFSPFAISSITEEIASVEASEENTESVSDENDVKRAIDDETELESNIAEQEDKPVLVALMVFVLAGVAFIGLFGYNNREYCEECYERVRSKVSNHDGKRYRRIKR